MWLSFFQIQDLGQSRSKSAFFQKDTYLAFSFLFPSVLLSCRHYFKVKLRMCFAQPSFCIFEWCGIKEPLLLYYLWEMRRKIENSIFSTKIESFQVNWNWQPKPFCTKKAQDKSSASSQGRCLESFSRKVSLFTFIPD